MTGGSFTIEALDPADVPALDAILAIQHGSFSRHWSRSSLADLFDSAASRVYIARAGERVVGFCACWLFEDELHVNLIAVAEDCRRQGIGARLMRHALAATAAVRATLEVRRSNVAAVRMYESLGFSVTAVRERYYEDPIEDALILWMNP